MAKTKPPAEVRAQNPGTGETIARQECVTLTQTLHGIISTAATLMGILGAFEAPLVEVANPVAKKVKEQADHLNMLMGVD